MFCHVFVVTALVVGLLSVMLDCPLSVMPGLVPGMTRRGHGGKGTPGEMSCDVMEAFRCAPLPLGGRASRRDGSLPGFGRRPLACGRFRRQCGARVGCGHACLLPGQGRDEVSPFRALSRGRGRGAAGGRIAAARLARLIARARRQTHLARPFPPGCFSRPPAVAFCRKAERRPRKPPLSTFILHHMGESQARPGTENENTGDFSWIADGMEARTGARRPSPVVPPPIMPPSVMPVITSPGMTIWGRRAWRCRAGGGFPAGRYAPPAGQSPSRASLTEASSPCRLTISS